jgi:hypothetical protein
MSTCSAESAGQSMSAQTFVISNPLVKINPNIFLTINSPMGWFKI